MGFFFKIGKKVGNGAEFRPLGTPKNSLVLLNLLNLTGKSDKMLDKVTL